MRHRLPHAIAATLLLLGGGASSAQPEDPRFEFVSVRRVPPACGVIAFNLRCELQVTPRSTWRVFPGGRLEITNQTAIDVVRVAYGLERIDPKHLSGGPGWLKSERYDIIALTGSDGLPGTRGEGQTARIRLMLRALLEDRFKLRVRLVPKKTEVFVLTRAAPDASGPGLRVSSGACREPPREWGLPACASYSTATGRIDAVDVSMAELAEVLSHAMRTPVVDETGMTERYDVSVSVGRPAAPFTVTRRSSEDQTSIAATLRTELGLNWQRAKRDIDRVEIKGAERPRDD